MATTLIIVILAVLLVTGIVRFVREKNQVTPTSSEIEDSAYVTTQEEDHSNYEESYQSPVVEEKSPVEKVPAKKAPAKKESTAKKPATKKPASKTAKKSTSKKSTK